MKFLIHLFLGKNMSHPEFFQPTILIVGAGKQVKRLTVLTVL